MCRQAHLVGRISLKQIVAFPSERLVLAFFHFFSSEPRIEFEKVIIKYLKVEI